MPLYLCQPGTGHPEPWRHGIQVYASPFAIDAQPPLATAQQQEEGGATDGGGERGASRDLVVAVPGSTQTGGQPIRRVRHAEIVLVDDVCVAHDRYWLRLRWPGNRGGFSGYIAMGLVSEYPYGKPEIPFPPADESGGDDSQPDPAILGVDSLEDRAGPDDVDLDDPAREETSMPPSEPPNLGDTAVAVCLRTGLPFQTSPAMKLLPMYDDGLTPSVAMIPLNTEPVFCRICREGLHDDADDEQPSPAAENEDAGGGGGANEPASRQTSMGENIDFDALDDAAAATAAGMQEPIGVGPIDAGGQQPSVVTIKGPVTPHPAYAPNPHALDNPLLAPCECSGSMAFVHYLCVEQWRCRSRHPDAQNGLGCETCGTAYALPPPASRPANVPQQMEQEDWLDAMPPHVMQALRQPHIWWRIGAAIVRRRWLRPMAPIVMSPVVALYCRARRLLKKRGVARRRWACSLCRRRARWKCVRCLRSYYCSRQCQNVSWHIVHKHVCYKPARFWWSVVLYGATCLAVFPGILRDPLMYDLGLCLIPISFIVMGILGGSMATFLKKSVGVDLRGRLLEFVVLLWTIWLTVISWGLTKGFFGNPQACYGAVGSYSISSENLDQSRLLASTRKVLLAPGKSYYLTLDRLARNSGSFLEAALCSNNNKDNDGCFDHLPHANADFFTTEFDGQACAGDLRLVVSLYIAAFFAYSGFAFYKYLEKRQNQQRQRGGGGGRRAARLHQD